MKKYSEILTEIKKARATITDEAKTEKELDKLAFIEARKNGSEQEREAAHVKYKAAEALYIKELEKNEAAKIKLEILKDNARQALAAELLPTICEVWNKYEGKAHGEKTAEKIRTELKTATGYYISVGNKWRDARIYISLHGSGAPFYDLELCAIWTGTERPALDCNNKILKLSPEMFRVYCCGEYVEDVNAHVKALKKAHKAAKEAEKALDDAVSVYNALTRGNIQQASRREGVKNWLI